MLELLVSSPRVAAGAVIGAIVGLSCAYVVHAYFPAVSALSGALIAGGGLAVGVFGGAKWETRR